MTKKIIYAGTPEFAVAGLKQLVNNNDYEVIAVYTQPDRPAGRGRKLTASPIKEYALKHNIPVYQPLSLKEEKEQTFLQSLDADLMVVAAYGIILPKEILVAPKLGCINIHASLLPRWRGAAPIQRAILAGDKETGITIMQMDSGLDTGDILLKKSCQISVDDNASSLHDKLMDLGGITLIETLTALFKGSIKPEKQDDSLTLYAKKLSKSESTISWNSHAQEILRQINAFNPWPVAQTSLDNKVIRIWQAELTNKTSKSAPGTVTNADKNGILVNTGKGVLNLTIIQIPGKRKMPVAEIINSLSFDDSIFS